MRRSVARVTRALAVALLAAAASAQAQIPITVEDIRVPEQSAGFWPLQVFVRLPGPAGQVITVDWSIVPGSATQAPGNDYTAGAYNGTFTFSIGEDSKPVNLQINGDTVNEWSPTTKQDEVFFVQLSNPSANATLGKPRGTITLLDDDRSMPGVQFLAAASSGTVTSGSNKLLWRVPPAPTQPTDVKIRWNTGVGCASPASTTEPLTGSGAGEGFYAATFLYTMGGPGAPQAWPHTSLQLIPYCYSLFAYYGASPTGEIASIKATPFNAAGNLKWTYTSGSASVVPPTVGADGIYTVDNDGVVHAMQRGDAGGAWPTTWNPVALGKPAQNRSPVVPMKVAPTTGDWRLFVGTDGGGLHSVDARDGRLVWSRSSAFSNALPSLGGVQAPPAGLFKNFGGNNDMILVGTNNGSNQFFALDPQTGGTLASYPHAQMGTVNGMAVVDYAANRVYFGTSTTNGTLFALDLGAVAAPGLTLSLEPWNPKPMGSGTTGAPVLRNGRVYLGDSTNQIHALHLADGTSYSVGTLGDGPAKGFLWPDRRDDRLYFATTSKVQAVRDTGSFFNQIWQVSVMTPSMVLLWPGTDYLYVGDGNGRLVQINVNDQSSNTLVLESGSQIGAPSFDRVSAGQEMVIVGSSSGTIYAVRVPLP